MNTLKIETFQYINLEYEYAGVIYRILARLIDWGICFAYFMLLLFTYIGIKSSNPSDLLIVLMSLSSLPVLFYTLVSEIFMNGQTIGKRAMKIKVMSLNGAPVTIGQYFLRWMFLLIDYISYIGLIMIAVSAKKQRLGDLVAGTTVVSLIPRSVPQRPAPSRYAEDYRPVFMQVVQLSDADMQVVKEVVRTAKASHNPFLPIVDQASEKMRAMLDLHGHQYNGIDFLEAVIMDYNFLTSKEQK